MSQQNNSTNKTEPTFSQKVRWPLIVVGLLGTHASLMMLGVSWALANASSFATPAVYRSTMSWDDHQLALQQSKDLGWELQTTASVVTKINGDRQVTFAVFDEHSQSVVLDSLKICLYHPTQASQCITRKLTPQEDGRFVVTLPMRLSGTWHLQASGQQIKNGAIQRFYCEQEIWIAPLKPSALLKGDLQ